VIIAIVGAESTGKSTLAADLANYYEVSWLPEFARQYLTQKWQQASALERTEPLYDAEDLCHIGCQQWRLENRFLTAGNECGQDPLILDTDLLVIRMWWRLKYHREQPWVEQKLKRQSQRYYLLTAPDMPWQADPLREDETGRADIHRAYQNVLKSGSQPFREVRGGQQVRLAQALSAIESWRREEHDIR